MARLKELRGCRRAGTRRRRRLVRTLLLARAAAKSTAKRYAASKMRASEARQRRKRSHFDRLQRRHCRRRAQRAPGRAISLCIAHACRVQPESPRLCLALGAPTRTPTRATQLSPSAPSSRRLMLTGFGAPDGVEEPPGGVVRGGPVATRAATWKGEKRGGKCELVGTVWHGAARLAGCAWRDLASGASTKNRECTRLPYLAHRTREQRAAGLRIRGR